MKIKSIKFLFFVTVIISTSKIILAESLLDNDISKVIRDMYFVQNFSENRDLLEKLSSQNNLPSFDKVTIKSIKANFMSFVANMEKDQRTYDDFIRIAENHQNEWVSSGKTEDINAAIKFYRFALYRKNRDVVARLSLIKIYSELAMNESASQWAFNFAENYFPQQLIDPNDLKTSNKMRSFTKWIFSHILSSEKLSDDLIRSLLASKEPAVTMAHYFTKKANAFANVSNFAEADRYTSAAFKVLNSIENLDVNNPTLVKELEKISTQVSAKLENEKSFNAAKIATLAREKENIQKQYDERLRLEKEVEATKKRADSRAPQKVSPKRIVVKISNISQSKINYFLKLGNSAWQKYSIEAGDNTYHYSDKNLSDIPEIFVYDNQLSSKFPEKKFEKRLKLKTLTTTVDEYENAQKNGSIPTYLLDTQDLGPLAPYEVIVIKDSNGKLINTYKK